MSALDNLRAAVDARDVARLRSAVGAAHLNSDAVPLLSELLLEDGHDSHEDIAFELGLTGDARAIGALAKASRIQFKYLLDWDNLHEFQRKCAYALARIGTPESRAALEGLASETDPYLRQYGEEGLEKWPLPFRR